MAQRPRRGRGGLATLRSSVLRLCEYRLPEYDSGKEIPMSIELTAQQQQALAEHPEFPPRVVNPRTNETFVLIPAEMFERLQNLLEDDTVYTTAEMVDRVMAEDDANDPQLAELQRKYGGVQG
jgi:PHD/YefM family antitoxin component YafN of YafNO toxin-antitoxin module